MICFKVTYKGTIELDVFKTDFKELEQFSSYLKRFCKYLENTSNTRADNSRFCLEELCMDGNFTVDRFDIDFDGTTYQIEKC